MKKFALALMTTAVAVFGFGAAAQAGPYGGTDPVVEATSPVPPGGNVTFNIENCTPGETLTITLDGTTVATVPCVDGAATTTVESLATPGTFSYVVTGTEGFSQTVSVTVSAPDGGGLPATGSDGTGSALLMGLGLLGVGAGLFGVSQFRRRSVVAA